MNNKLLIFIATVSFISCKKKEPPNVANMDGGTYFSIVQFARDQFTTFWGQPYTLQKVVTLNGKTDSSFVPVMQMDWASVLKPFFDSDISDEKYLEQYSFSMFDDNATVSRTYFYEAKNKKLLTKNLHIVTDPFNNKIKSIYIETEKNGKVQKLYYIPLKLIQIQEYESSFLGKDKNLVVKYHFL